MTGGVATSTDERTGAKQERLARRRAAFWGRVAEADHGTELTAVDLIPHKTWSEWRQDLRHALVGDQGAGFAISMLVHLVLLLLLAIPVVIEKAGTPVVTTLLPDVENSSVVLDAPVELEVASPEAPPGTSLANMVPLVDDGNLQTFDLKIDPNQSPQIAGEDAGTGADGDVLSSGRMAQPANAVVAGSFSVWSVPIRGTINNAPILGEPGDAPQRYQDYFIIVQVKLPRDTKAYRLADLTGEVIGTDLYKQQIPARAYLQAPDGRIVRAHPTRALKPENGVVQLMIHVPGADAFVQDTITVHSKVLKEEQELVLTFQPGLKGLPFEFGK